MSEKCSGYSGKLVSEESTITGEYVCYCNKVTEQDIRIAIEEKGAGSVAEVIKMTGAMVNSNCKVNNPKGTCCYPDIVQVFKKYKK
jgi:bacterioferritin-associated ferredoxin